jgi:hypothetical protein
LLKLIAAKNRGEGDTFAEIELIVFKKFADSSVQHLQLGGQEELAYSLVFLRLSKAKLGGDRMANGQMTKGDSITLTAEEILVVIKVFETARFFLFLGLPRAEGPWMNIGHLRFDNGQE